MIIGDASTYKRIFLIVCDSMGFGAADDAADYGDFGANTIGHIAEAVGGLQIYNLDRLGAGHLCHIKGAGQRTEPHGVCCLLKEQSNGKDTLTGHWEMMGIITEHPFVTFTETGFPDELIAELEAQTGRVAIGNKSASGTAILDELAFEEIADANKMIVYTSADSVLQICGNENGPGGLEELYRCCEIARDITLSHPEWRVARIIARPYIQNDDGSFTRTANRKDYSVAPPQGTVLNALNNAGFDVMAVGKINDIFSGSGITEHVHSQSSVEGMQQTIRYARRDDWTGLCFTNLSDFDVLWGHRRNPQGYAKEIEQFDVALGRLMGNVGMDDLIIITADHGNDPTALGTDHTREDVPMICWSPRMQNDGIVLEPRNGFGTIGATIAKNFNVAMPQGCVGKPLDEVFYMQSNN